jgi:hypothetical protein
MLVKGLRFERIGQGRYYNVVFHLGGTYVPVSDETIEELKAQSLLPAERFLDFPQGTEELRRSGDADYGPPGRHPRTVVGC